MHVDKTIPLWLFWDLYGQFHQIKVFGKSHLIWKFVFCSELEAVFQSQPCDNLGTGQILRNFAIQFFWINTVRSKFMATIPD